MSDPRDPATPEYLEPGRGGPLEPTDRTRRRSPLLLAGLGVVGLGLVGGAAFGAYWYLADGAEAAEAFPADSVGYVGLTLDPRGQQKLEALQTLEKIPSIAEELDLEGPLDEVDVRRMVAEAVLADAPCDVDYDSDVEPWLGDRFGVAAVPDGDALPAPVIALEVTDPDAADRALDSALRCEGSDADAGWVVQDGWMVVAETTETAQDVVDRTGEGSLADDEDFRRWTGEAGDEGVLTMYAAPEAPAVLLEGLSGALSEELGGLADLEDDDVQEQLADFEGMAATLRFQDAGVEIEVAGAADDTAALDADGGAGGLVASLPDETALALGIELGDDWSTELSESTGEDLGELPVDPEALLGGTAALAVGPELTPDALLSGIFSGDVAGLPVALLTGGEPAAAEDAVAQAGPLAADLEVRETGSGVLVGPRGDWLDRVQEGGSLGEVDAFSDVVPDAEDALALAFLDLDAVAERAGAEGADEADLRALRALGVSARLDGDVVRALLRLTVD